MNTAISVFYSENRLCGLFFSLSHAFLALSLLIISVFFVILQPDYYKQERIC